MEGISVQDECPYCGDVHTGPCTIWRTPERKTKTEEQPPVRKKKKNQENIACESCGKTFTSRAKLAQHRYVHTGEKPYVCATCNKGFSSKFRLVRHHLIHSDSRKYTCFMCAKNFHRKDHLKTHAKTHVKQEILKCDCGKEYTSPASFRRHKALHSAQEGELKCQLCHFVGKDKEMVLEHLKSHSGSRVSRSEQERKHSCPSCGRKFFMKKEMWRHSVVHTGVRDFLCQFCPKAYRRRDHLLRHIRRCHNEGQQQPQPTRRTGSLPNFRDAFQSP